MQQTQATRTRKQAAPAAGSKPQASSQFPSVTDTSQLSDDQFMQWGMANPGAVNNSFAAFNNQLSTPSNQLIRRNTNQQVATSNQPYAGSGNMDGQMEISEEQIWEDNEELERRAAAAKKDAQSRSPPKNIPPFIQKLSKFLDESNADQHTRQLIRWSDDGNSFIVLDEDKFAQNLVPELFKHSNYASFVRQLNMYGFHKKVGLSDNSMRASEKKSKSPSEYQNAYFKRGRPELLWLIQKPKSETLNKKRKKGRSDGEGDSGDESRVSVDVTIGGSGGSNTDVVTKSHYVSLQKDVQALQSSQRQITQMLTRLRDDNNQYIRQASTLVAQHERHENSINAILTFLATFYNRNMGNGNLPTMFPDGMSGQQQGNVVDVGDYEEQLQPQVQRPPPRRPLALLPAPNAPSATSSQRPSPNPVSANSSTSPQLRQRPERRQSPRANALRPGTLQARVSSYQSSPESSAPPSIKGSPKSPKLPNQYSPDNGSPVQVHDDMMNVINNANSASAQASADGLSGPQFDFDAALQHFQNANGNRALTPQERDNTLNLMNTQSGTTTPLPTSSATRNTGFNMSNADRQYQLNNYLDRFNTNRDHIDMLQRLQEQQNNKVQNLADRLQPLSPSGSIPGLALSPQHSGTQLFQPQGQPSMYSQPSFGNSGDFDINSFLNSDYFANANNALDPNALPDFNDMDFNFNPVNDSNGVSNTTTTGQPNDAGLFTKDDNLDGASPQTVAEDYGDAAAGTATAARRAGSIAGGGGEILGSVGSSSGAPSPMVEDEEDEEEGGSARKKRRL